MRVDGEWMEGGLRMDFVWTSLGSRLDLGCTRRGKKKARGLAPGFLYLLHGSQMPHPPPHV